MSTSKPKSAATDEELSKLFEGIDVDNTPAVETTPTAPKGPVQPPSQSEQELFADLDRLTAERPTSRSNTPKVPSTGRSATRSPKRGTSANPPISTAESSTVKETTGNQKTARNSAESSDSRSISFTPATSHSNGEGDINPGDVARTENTAPRPEDGKSSGGSWWGGLVATASAAVKTAEAAVKEIQQNEEAKKWAEQVKGNVGALRELGGELRSRALPTFTNILHTLAPPISAHERLQIHITHDLVGYPSLDGLVYQTFSRVMAQVEGGDLLVIQRGHESSPRRGSDVGFGTSTSGWGDGPWWRQPAERRDLGIVKGLVEGTKLVRASAESFANEFYSSRGGLEEATKKATENLSESNPVRSSDIFLAIQAIGQKLEPDLFAGVHQGASDQTPEAHADEVVAFAIYLHDPVHGITFSTITQTFPQKWVDWLDASPIKPQSPEAPASPTQEKSFGIFGRRSQEGAPSESQSVPEDIAQILIEGGADPREWAAEWIEEVLALGTSIVAQRYVARRMGVGEGSIGRGKSPQAVLESNAGEAARAI
ncbi:MAG: hypothetical protein M1816_000344 [Peltula sp. TS41687]|nr:MAG: hypothetical protein M1816_000344 [Peltula sp. TS41687]